MVLYVDRPLQDQPAGLWGVDVADPEATPVIVSQELMLPSGDGAFQLHRDERGRAVIERTADGQRWTIDTGGGVPAISPDGQWVLWSSAGREGPYEQRGNTLYVMSLERPDSPRALVTVWGGGYAGWLADSQGVLVVGRPSLDTYLRDLSVVTVPGGGVRLLLREELIANIQLAPDGKYVLCTVYFSGDPQRDGVWLLGTSGEEPRKMRFFGAYQWRDARHIIYVPLRDAEGDSHVFRQYEVLSRENIALTDPATEFFSIAGDDWVVSPDGKRIAFVDSRDKAIWVLELERIAD
jgi:Tol biopolymer transport system component